MFTSFLSYMCVGREVEGDREGWENCKNRPVWFVLVGEGEGVGMCVCEMLVVIARGAWSIKEGWGALTERNDSRIPFFMRNLACHGKCSLVALRI